MEEKTKIRKQVLVAAFGIMAIGIIMAITIYKAEKDASSDKVVEVAAPEENLQFDLINGPELKDRIKFNSIQIIDIRTTTEFGLEHIPDSINIPVQILNENTLINQDVDIALVGTSNEEEVRKAISIINKLTQKNVYVLQAGFVDWKFIGGTTVTWGDPTSFTDQAKTSFISIDDFKKTIDSGRKITIIDVRKNVYFTEGHIKGAINIPLSDIEKRRNEISTTKEIIIYADDELESFQAAVKLFDLKLVASKVLRGGINEWKEKRYEIVK